MEKSYYMLCRSMEEDQKSLESISIYRRKAAPAVQRQLESFADQLKYFNKKGS
jgi:hypothetical protein